MEESFSHLRKKESTPRVLERMRHDLVDYLEGFSNKTFAIRTLAKETGLNSKTIKRLLAGENKPTYQTLFKLYSAFLEEDNYEKLLKKCPECIALEIKKYNPQTEEQQQFVVPHFLEFIQKEPLLIEIIILAATGPLHKNRIAFKYGEYGLELSEKLLQAGFIKENEKETYSITNKVPNFDAETLKYMGPYFVQRFLKAQNTQVKNQNVINFFAEGLNEEGKKRWIEIETNSFYQKVEVANNPKYRGDIPMFTFGAIDGITSSEQL